MLFEPSSRHRKKPTSTTGTAAAPAAAASREIKLICRFNGAFSIKNNSSRYIGGETRIISIDRNNIDLSKLHFRISQLCPNLRSFTLKYHLPWSGGLGSEYYNKDAPFLISISSDDDVWCMIEEYDKMELHDKHNSSSSNNARLWIYVCGSDCSSNELLLAKRCPLNPKDGNLWDMNRNLNSLHNYRVDFMGDQQFGKGLIMRNFNRENFIGCYHYGACKQRSARLDGGGFLVSATKCHHGLRPKSNISKQGQCFRSYYYYSNPKKSGCTSARSLVQGRSSLIHLTLYNSLSTEKSGVSMSKDCHLACPVVENTVCQQDLLTGSPYKPYQASHQSDFSKTFYAAPVSDEPLTTGWAKVFGISRDGQSAECNKELMMNNGGDSKNGTHDLDKGVASSVELLDNLSLSSKRVELPASPFTITDVASSLRKTETNHLADLLDRNISTGRKADKPSAVKSTSCALNTIGVERADTRKGLKCSKAIGGISDDLATRQLQTIKNSDLEHIKELGSGTYGTVYYGKWKGSDVAIKRIKPSCFTEGSLEKDRLVADFWKEAHILGQLHHPNIVAFYGVITDGPLNNLGTVTEYMVNGSLKQVLRKKDRTIDRRKRIILAMDAAFGMEYLHEKNIVHFDLKSPNLLVNMRDPQRPVCKIGDLGLSKIKKRTLVSGGVRGTIPWMAPELLNSNNKMVTEKVDVYSFGIVLWELLTGEEPYADLRSEEMIAGIIKGTLRPEIPSWCDPAWRSLMEKCWSSGPESRPAFSEIAKELRAMSAAMNIK